MNNFFAFLGGDIMTLKKTITALNIKIIEKKNH